MVTIIFSYYGLDSHIQIRKERVLSALFSEIYNKLDNYVNYNDCDSGSGILTLSIRPIYSTHQIKSFLKNLKIDYQKYKCNIIILGNGQRIIDPLKKLLPESWCV